MADRRPHNQRDNQHDRNRKRPARVEYDPWTGESYSADEESHIERVPQNNYQLNQSYNKSRFPEVGLTAERLEAEDDTVRMFIDPHGETVRLNERSEGELKTLGDIAAQEAIDGHIGNKRIVEGELAPQVATALILRDRDGRERVAAFARPELETFGKKMSGPTGLLNALPGKQALTEIEDEYLLFGRTKIGNEKVILAVDTGEGETVQASRIYSVKTRLSRSRQNRLQMLLHEKGSSAKQIHEAALQAEEFMKPHRIVFMKKKSLNHELDEKLTNIQTSIGTEKEIVRGILHYSDEEKRPTAIIPVCMAPEESGIDMDSIEAIDGTGEERAITMIEDADSTQADHLRIIAGGLGRPETVQKKPHGPVILPPSIEAQLQHDPVAVLPMSLPKAA